MNVFEQFAASEWAQENGISARATAVVYRILCETRGEEFDDGYNPEFDRRVTEEFGHYAHSNGIFWIHVATSFEGWLVEEAEKFMS